MDLSGDPSQSLDLFEVFPDEIILHVFSFLKRRQLGICATVSRNWKRLADDNVLWKQLFRDALSVDMDSISRSLCLKLTDVWKENYDSLPLLFMTDRSTDYHNLVLDDHGHMWVTGKAPSFEKMDLPTDGCSYKRVETAEDLRFSFVSAGFKHFAAISTRGDLYVWGKMPWMRLWDSDFPSVPKTPQLVKPLMGKCVQSISCGRYHTGCVTIDKSVYVWGDPSRAWLPSSGRELTDRRSETFPYVFPGLKAVAVACGDEFTIIRSEDGSVRSFGLSTRGQLGRIIDDDGEFSAHSRRIGVVKGIGEGSNKKHPVGFICAGDDHAGAITENGELWMWGSGALGQLGTGRTNDEFVPVRVSALRGHIVSLALGLHSSCAVSRNGTVYTWGSRSFAGIGAQDHKVSLVRPLVVRGLRHHDIVSVSLGCGSGCAITILGQVFGWGYNGNGNLGLDDDTMYAPVPQLSSFALPQDSMPPKILGGAMM